MDEAIFRADGNRKKRIITYVEMPLEFRVFLIVLCKENAENKIF